MAEIVSELAAKAQIGDSFRSRCGRLLVGLRELRCPECGMQFTIDELIRAQLYEVSKGP